MDMKIDAQKLKALREARAWSQEHLAEVSNLSLRTIQRIEAEGSASPESRLALAAALSIEVAELNLETDAVASSVAASELTPTTTPPRNWCQGRGYLLLFAVVCGFLLVLDISHHQTVTWSKWPVLGWSLAILLRYLRPGRRRG